MAMGRLLVALALALGAAMFAAPASAQRYGDEWVLLGTRDVDLTLDRDRIDVTRAKGRFKALRLHAERNGIEIFKVVVTYSNGQVHNEERRINLLPGERTRPIDMRGDERFVDHIDLFYRTNPSATGTQRHAVVRVMGLQSDAGARATRPAPSPGYVPPPVSGAPAPVPGYTGQPSSPPPGAVMPANPRPIIASPSPKGRCGGPGEQYLGAATVNFGVDKDVIKVGAEIGKFDLIRLCVYENDIDLLGTRVNFVQGDAEVLNYAGLIRANHRTQELRFKGDRFIRDIEVLYKRRQQFRGTAYVEVWGEYAEGWVDREASQYRGGWVMLSSHAARFVGFERDVAVVPRNAGGFKKLRLDVRNRDITLDKLIVTYGDDQKESLVAARQRVENGKSLVFDLKGVRPVPIKEIEAVYRSRIFDRDAVGQGRSIVEISGQR